MKSEEDKRLMKELLFSLFKETEREFKFDGLIIKKRQEEKEKMLSDIQKRINSFNYAIAANEAQ